MQQSGISTEIYSFWLKYKLVKLDTGVQCGREVTQETKWIELKQVPSAVKDT